jgi:lysophospholipase L1-like esterase
MALRGADANSESLAKWFAFRLIAILLGCGLGLVTVEIVLRTTWAGGNHYYLWPPNYSRTFVLAPGIIHGVAPGGRIQINSRGIRGSEWSRNRSQEYRILAVGGSTTESLYLDDAHTWPALLEAAMPQTTDNRHVWVGNVGRAGFNTRDHLGFMQLVAHQYDVDTIVMLVGGNDMIHRLMQHDKYDPHFTEDKARYRSWLYQRFAILPVSIEARDRWFFKRTALWRLAKRVQEAVVQPDSSPGAVVRDAEGRWLAKVRTARRQASLVDTPPLLDSGLAEYARNIRGIVAEARRRATRLVLLTQPSIWSERMPASDQALLWWGWRPDGVYYTTGVLATAMASYNRRLLETCMLLAVECIDLAARVPRTSEFFFDDIHFTDAGARRVAAELAAELRSRPPFVDSR